MPEFAYKRADRVAHLIQQELGRLLVEGIKDPRVGFVTVTHVHLTDDLRSACAYVSIFGEPSAREASLVGLRAATGFLRRELGQRLKLRYNPQLTFAHDDSLDRAQRLDTLLSAAARGCTDAPEAAAQEPLPPAQTGREMPPPPPLAAPSPRRLPASRRKSARKRRHQPKKSH